MIKDLLKSNIYDVYETIVIMGACVPYMQTKGYEEIKKYQKTYMNCV